MKVPLRMGPKWPLSKISRGIMGVYCCTFYKLSLSVQKEMAQLERRLKLLFHESICQIDQRAGGMFRCLIIQTAINVRAPL